MASSEKAAAIMDAAQKAATVLAKLSDAEWLQVKCDEDRRRSQQREIRDLSRELRSLRDREPAR
jgi:hypothetical protein